jgi:hypothetical protein
MSGKTTHQKMRRHPAGDIERVDMGEQVARLDLQEVPQLFSKRGSKRARAFFKRDLPAMRRCALPCGLIKPPGGYFRLLSLLAS